VDGDDVTFRHAINRGSTFLAELAFDVVAIILHVRRAFDLDAKQTPPAIARADVHDEVVRLIVPVGLGNHEAQLTGAMEEGEFGKLSTLLGVGRDTLILGRFEARIRLWRFHC